MSVGTKSMSTVDTGKKIQTPVEKLKYQDARDEKFNADSLRALEMQLKQIWSQYINYLDKNGLDETAKSLKSKYFSLYQNYKKNKNWKNVVTNN